MSEAKILISGTGDFREAVGVKTAKLCVEQDQIGKHAVRQVPPVLDFRVDRQSEIERFLSEE